MGGLAPGIAIKNIKYALIAQADIALQALGGWIE